MDVTRQDPLVGSLVDGRYLVRSRIATGGMATVYLAVDRRLERDVALKVMHGEGFGPGDTASTGTGPGPGLVTGVTDGEYAARFVREARAVARLSHPHVVEVFDQGTQGLLLYLVMEYLPGRTLREVLAERGTLSPREVLAVLDPVLGALSAAHRAGLVHGDVKPENVILTDDGRIKVADFGLARAITPVDPRTGGGELFGTAAYVAPETVSRGVADARSDLYATGIVLFELLTGTQPFTGPDPLAVARRHVYDAVPRPGERSPQVPPALDEVVLDATDPDPARRTPDAATMLTQLRRAVGSLSAEQIDLRVPRSDPRPSTGTRPLRPVALPELDRHRQATAANGTPDVNPTAVLAPVRRRERASRSLVPRLPLDEATTAAVLGERRSTTLAAIGAALAVVLLVFVGVWWLSGGPGAYVDVPDLAGRTQVEAQRQLTALGLQARVTAVYDEKAATGQVLRTEPGRGEQVRKEGIVALTVSRGPQLISLPDLTGLTVSAATRQIEQARLERGRTTRRPDDSVGFGKVISSAPAGASQVRPGATVTLVVSSGAVLKGADSDRCVGLPGGRTDDETQVVLADCDASAGQAWRATDDGELVQEGTGKCLDVNGNSDADGAEVQLYRCNGGQNQQWTIEADGSVVGAGTGKCLDADRAGTEAGTPIQIWTCTGGGNQRWSRE